MPVQKKPLDKYNTLLSKWASTILSFELVHYTTTFYSLVAWLLVIRLNLNFKYLLNCFYITYNDLSGLGLNLALNPKQSFFINKTENVYLGLDLGD